MKTEHVHTLILGAGTSGLAAGCIMVKAGIKPVILEKDSVQAVCFAPFTVAISSSISVERVIQPDCQGGCFGVSFSAMTTADTRIAAGFFSTAHSRHVSPFRGFRRRMPWVCCWDARLDFLWSRAKPGNLCRKRGANIDLDRQLTPGRVSGS